MTIVSEFLSDRRQRVRLNGKVSVSADVISEVPQVSVLGSFLFILYILELFHVVENHMASYADDTKIYAVILRPISRSQVIAKSGFGSRLFPVFKVAHEAKS